MAKLVRDLMNAPSVKVGRSAQVIDAARQMAEANVGAVLIEDRGKPCGMLTDRDIAVRVVAKGLDPAATPVADVCSKDLATLSPDADLEDALSLMRERALRRVLVVDSDDRAVGILSLGDLAIERDTRSVLGQISAALPQS